MEKGTKFFWTVLVIVLMFVFFSNINAQDTLRESLWIEAPLNEFQTMPDSCIFESSTPVAIWSFSSGEEEKGSGARDADLRAGRGQIAREWCESHNLIIIGEYHAQGKAGERGIYIIAGKDLPEMKMLIAAGEVILDYFAQLDSVVIDAVNYNTYRLNALEKRTAYKWSLLLGSQGFYCDFQRDMIGWASAGIRFSAEWHKKNIEKTGLFFVQVQVGMDPWSDKGYLGKYYRDYLGVASAGYRLVHADKFSFFTTLDFFYGKESENDSKDFTLEIIGGGVGFSTEYEFLKNIAVSFSMGVIHFEVNDITPHSGEMMWGARSSLGFLITF